LSRRFWKEVETGKLVILNVAVWDEEEERDFWFCDDMPVWSSVHEHIAGRNGAKRRKIRVQTTRFKKVLSRFGLPYYLKIDIEGADSLCLRDLDRHRLPKYISLESECAGSDAPLREDQYLANIRLLKECGYNQFRLVNQNTLIPLSKSNINRVLDAKYRARFRREIERKNKWRFPEGSSGPWGEGIPGAWMTFSDAIDVYRMARELFFLAANMPLYGFWFDWHATKF
jgi:FkbM family methyltransferase